MTDERMRDGRDAEDALYLEAGDHARLIGAYYDVIVQRSLASVPGPAGWDVAHAAIERLLGELQRGKRYSVPYRVVVHQVVTWTIKEHWQGPTTNRPLPEDWDPATVEQGFHLFEQDFDLERMFEELPRGQREACELRYLEGLEIDEIAVRLDKTRNAVDQALHNAHKKLRELSVGL